MTAAALPRIRFVSNRGEFAGQIEGGWRSPIGWVIGHDGERIAVFAGHERDAVIAEEKERRKAARRGAAGHTSGRPPRDRSASPKSVSEILDERRAKAEQGTWIPASGGTERPFRTRSGKMLQYLYQPSTGRHAYYDVGSDMILSDEEAWAHLGNSVSRMRGQAAGKGKRAGGASGSARDRVYVHGRDEAERDQVFLHMMKTNPITKAEFERLVKKRPEIWQRYAAYFRKDS